MVDVAKADWQALLLAYQPSPGKVFPAPGSGVSALSDTPSAETPLSGDDLALRLDLVRERAAIMEYDGGLTRSQADELAYTAHNIIYLGKRKCPPDAGSSQ